MIDSQGRWPGAFLAVVAVAGVITGLLSVATGGVPILLGLPAGVSFLAVSPVAATAFAVAGGGRAAARRLWFSLVRPATVRPAMLWLVALGFSPLAWALGNAIWQATGHPVDPLTTPVAMAPLYFIAYAAGAVLEEVGWTAYATAPLVQRFGVPIAGILIGLVWTSIHWLSYAAMGHDAAWIAATAASTVLSRIVMTWIYARGGQSAVPAIVMHALSNTVETYPGGIGTLEPFGSAVAKVLVTVVALPVLRRRKLVGGSWRAAG